MQTRIGHHQVRNGSSTKDTVHDLRDHNGKFGEPRTRSRKGICVLEVHVPHILLLARIKQCPGLVIIVAAE